MRHEYTLFKRYKEAKNKKGVVWFFYYHDEDGTRKPKSTGKSLKHEAVAVVEKFLSQNDSKDRTLNEYAKTFFVWDECLYIKRQLAKGKRFSKTNAKLRRDHLVNYILPQFGKRSLSSLNRVEIENWLVALKSIKTGEQLSNQTKNHILYAFRTILREAEREGIIPFNCLSTVESLAVQPKTRDVFSQAELKKLFPSDLEALTKIWWEVEYAYYFFILATKGMRRGEARALKWKHVIEDKKRNGLVIEEAIKNDNTTGSTKTGKSRVVVLSQRAQEILKHWKASTPFNDPEDLIFYGSNGSRPIMGKTLQNRFQKALEKAEIKTEGRNLVIHSFRHTYNTLLKNVLPLEILQETTGHSSESMTERYNHPSLKDSYRRILEHEDAFDGLF
ncbi:site-specific integrase [uncultured Sphaerochaeta sp.]|uniref:tyrosine-type recombinase/integrase n=1 Tax=uncultured Sphaerochaeta sp. TaxID=886478 RepID=UPI002AA6DFB6|nr:site-specific integrase [uncultured Sphaerochaeta sp.]